MSGVNRQIVLASYPEGMPRESDFRLEQTPLPEPGAGEALVRVQYLSVDPYMRGRISGRKTYARSTEIGEVMIGGAVGQVERSNDPRLAAGDVVEGMLGWQEYAVAPAKTLRKIDPEAAPVSTALSVLGMPGLTAYFGLLDICHPQAGETVVVSGAAGAVGSLVGQIAKIRRCRAVGIAGSDEKVRYLTADLGFDEALNYKSARDLPAALKEICGSGIDIYFDNVGGAITDAVMQFINSHARISVCGQISQYNATEPDVGPRWFTQLMTKQARAEGFLVMQWADRYEEALRQLGTWLREKRIRYRESVAEGLENAPKAFISMLSGGNIGKQLVKISA
ncbi:MAG TPA: NADP-dependent oxidoreductase [Bryobacteraceae bacterium]|nr:NADP-dependent oxidoreductase [Bryobacteraceae bacterium]